MIKNFSLDSAMYGVVVAIALLTVISTALTGVAIALGVIFILYEFFRTKKFPQFDTEILKVLGIYFLAQIIIALTSIDPAVSFREVIGELHRFLPLIFALAFVKTENRLRGVLIAILISSLVNDIVGVYQYFFKGMPRAQGLEYSPTFFASSMLIQIPTLIFMTKENLTPKKLRPVVIGTIFLSLFCLGLSMTRGAWLAFVAIIFIFAILEKSRRLTTMKIFAALTASFIVVVLLSPQLQERVETLTDRNFQSNTERILMWQSAINIFKDYPLHGIGQKMFEKMYNEKYISPDAKERPDEFMSGHTHPHNNFLFVMSEGGLIGLSSFIFLYGYFFRRFFLQYKRENFMKFSAGLTLFLILAALHLEGLTDTNLNQVKLMREVWVIAGALLASEKFLGVKYK